MTSVATGPSKPSFQCRYRDGSVRKSTTVALAIRHVFGHLANPRIVRAPASPAQSDSGGSEGAVEAPSEKTPPPTQDHPEGLGRLAAEILPAVGRAPVQVGAVARVQHVSVAIVVERDLALDHVEELHLSGLG